MSLAPLKELPYPNPTFPTFPNGLFTPNAANSHYVKVLNPDGVSEGDGGWQRLTLVGALRQSGPANARGRRADALDDACRESGPILATSE